jgi:hypothetical protein
MIAIVGIIWAVTASIIALWVYYEQAFIVDELKDKIDELRNELKRVIDDRERCVPDFFADLQPTELRRENLLNGTYWKSESERRRRGDL